MREPSMLQQLEGQLAEARELVATRDLVIKLSENRDFRKLVHDRFFVTECARYARESADPALGTEHQKDALAMAQAAGHFKRWLHIQVLLGNTAAGQLKEVEQAIEEEQAEENQGAE